MLIVKDEYIRLLNRNYCVTAHLAERLDELRGLTVIANFSEVITTAITGLELQLENINGFYKALQINFTFSDSTPLVGCLENLFSYVHNLDGGVSLFALLDYITFADSILQETAKLAELPPYRIKSLKLPKGPLYDAFVLQPIKTLVNEASITSWRL